MSAIAAFISKRLQGKVAVITGGASGLGACTAKRFVENGAKVIVADVQDELGLSLCKDLGSSSTENTISYVHCDVTKDVEVKNLVDVAVSRHGKLDIMHSNAGILGTYGASIVDVADNYDDFKRVVDVNLYGGFLCAKHAARAMIGGRADHDQRVIAGGGGVILFTASASATSFSNICPHAYTASKAGIVGLAKNLCVDLGKHGIRVNCISPHVVATPLIQNPIPLDKGSWEKVYESCTALRGSVLTAEDVANMAVFLASDESKVISGQDIVMDGGFSVANPTFNIKLKEQLMRAT
ncbi:hypothetical protein Dimus_006967 [Dionaea muscipula]